MSKRDHSPKSNISTFTDTNATPVVSNAKSKTNSASAAAAPNNQNNKSSSSTAKNKSNTVNFATSTKQNLQKHNNSDSNGIISQEQEQTVDAGEVDAEQAADAEAEEPPTNTLYKSARLKGYITLIFASVINFTAARSSDAGVTSTNVVSASPKQQAYAEATSVCSGLVCFLIFFAHLDRCSPLSKVWIKIFKDGSPFELILVVFLVLWWSVATIIQTTVRGIAGDGKGQQNLYYSTWGCCLTAYWTLERWWMAYGWSSFKAFISSWPFRAPGWIAIFCMSFLTEMWYLDLYSNHADAVDPNSALDRHFSEVSHSEWQMMLFVGGFTTCPALVFIVIELFRETNTQGRGRQGSNAAGSTSAGVFNASIAASLTPQRPATAPRRSSRAILPQRIDPQSGKDVDTGGKGKVENILEGFCLVLLVALWIPTVIVATCPGGGASLVGNAYFFTWITTIFVMETFIWYVHDLRRGVHSALQAKEREYRKRQQEVLEKSRALESKRQMLQVLNDGNDLDDDEIIQLDSPVRPSAVDMISPSHKHPVFGLLDASPARNNNNKSSSSSSNDINTPNYDRNSPQTDRRQKRMNRRLDSEVDENEDDDELSILDPPETLRPGMSDTGSPGESMVFFDAQEELNDYTA